MLLEGRHIQHVICDLENATQEHENILEYFW